MSKKVLTAKEITEWLLDYCFIIDKVDELISQGYTFDEIVRAIKENIAEKLEEEKEDE